MQRKTRYIAIVLLYSFLAGGLVGPLLHQLHHGIEASKGPVHHHPDYDAIIDDTPHLNDHDFSCTLCSFSLIKGILSDTYVYLPDIEALYVSSLLQYQTISNFALPIRGPPAFS